MDVKFELEYNRYLKEVVDVLESDPEFRKKLETADENDFRSGKVAAELDFVSHHVRTQLDELKRSELARLRELMKLEEERKKAANDPHHNTHLDHSNPHTFEVQDLQMLMNKVRKDLEDADKQRREEFKEYEMMKEYESEEKMKEMDEQHKKEYLKKVEEEKKAAAKHDPVRPLRGILRANQKRRVAPRRRLGRHQCQAPVYRAGIPTVPGPASGRDGELEASRH
ncbi:unnamed protein product, partial [Nesidiocoris tenuis]